MDVLATLSTLELTLPMMLFRFSINKHRAFDDFSEPQTKKDRRESGEGNRIFPENLKYK